jgi:glycine/D-amino acid oxidase-like deaminating enzyme
MATTISVRPDYDQNNAWLEMLGPQPEPTMLTESLDADYVVVGAGYGGLAVARRLGELEPNSSVILIEAGQLGNNAAGRCSGFIIDHAHNIRAKGFAEDVENSRRLIDLNRAGLDWLDEIVHANSIDCDWKKQGKIHAAAGSKGVQTLEGFAASLDVVDEDYEMFDARQLKERFGTGYYQSGMLAPHSVTVNPAALTIGLASTLPSNVSVFSSSPVTEVDYGPPHKVTTPRGSVTARVMVLAANGFGAHFGFYPKHLLPMITWGSMTRPLTDSEVAELGGADDYAIIPAHPAGTTVRRRPDNRILIRNRYTFSKTSAANGPIRDRVRKVHEKSFRNRYPMLPDVGFEYTWGGALSLSRNGAGVCGEVAPGVFATMVYQGTGMAKGTISGKYLAEHITGDTPPQMTLLSSGDEPSRNYPEPFNSWGVRINSRWRSWQAGPEE